MFAKKTCTRIYHVRYCKKKRTEYHTKENTVVSGNVARSTINLGSVRRQTERGLDGLKNVRPVLMGCLQKDVTEERNVGP